MFEKPDAYVTHGLDLAYQAGKIGGSMPTVMNAANELAVSMFLNREVEFLDIYRMISYAMENHAVSENPGLDKILETEQEVYQKLKDMEQWRKK